MLLAPDLLNFFGSDGLVSVSSIHQYEHGPRFSIFFLLPASNSMVICIFSLLVLVSIMVMVGLYTRLNLVILFLCLVSFHHRNVLIFNSGDTLLRVLGFILIFSPAGDMFSLDYLRRRVKSACYPDQWNLIDSGWSKRLLQLQIAAVYCQSVFAKLSTETWWNGTAVYYTSRLEEFSRFQIPFVFDHLWTCNILTWGTLVVEFSLFTLIWIREFRYYVLFAGVLLHIGIDLSMNIPLFEYIMIASYIIFVEPQHLRPSIDLISAAFANALRTVVKASHRIILVVKTDYSNKHEANPPSNFDAPSAK
jgi:Vitamin K-dependent gamma-carboxylase